MGNDYENTNLFIQSAHFSTLHSFLHVLSDNRKLIRAEECPIYQLGYSEIQKVNYTSGKHVREMYTPLNPTFI